jgi:uncharacterized integral membrane protein
MRRAALIFLIVLVVLLAAIFAFNNPVRVPLDLGFMRLENVPVTLALTVALGIGWGLGLLSAGTAVVRVAAERRRLKRELRLAESEVKSLRSLPLQDAD